MAVETPHVDGWRALARPSLAYARAYTMRLAREHYENFPVASLLIPSHLRQHIANIYAFARIADDIADERLHDDKRLDALSEWEEELGAAYEGKGTHPVFVALEETIREFLPPKELFLDLIKAFKMDVVQTRYRTFDELLYYCRHSANPVGRLVLHIFGYRREDWYTYSDYICTALQLTNFWQDITVDLEKGRIYIPGEDMVNFGVTEYDLEKGVPTDGIRRLMEFEVQRTEEMFMKGKRLCLEAPDWRLRLELRLTWLGGMAILSKISKSGYNIFKRPALSRWDFARMIPRAIFAF